MPSAPTGFDAAELAKFTRAGRTIAAAVGVSAETWARGEAGIILKRWAGDTEVAKPEKTKGRSRLSVVKDYGATRGDVTINAGVRRGATPGIVWIRGRNNRFRNAAQITDGGSLTWGKYHHSADQWSTARPIAEGAAGKFAAAIIAGLKTVGLARQSVIQIADALGIDLATVPGRGVSPAGITKARAAVSFKGVSYINGLGHTAREAAGFFIELINRYPLGTRIGMDAGLARVIQGRLSYFDRNLAEGTFLSAKSAAKAYPYVEVLRLAA